VCDLRKEGGCTPPPHPPRGWGGGGGDFFLQQNRLYNPFVSFTLCRKHGDVLN